MTSYLKNDLSAVPPEQGRVQDYLSYLWLFMLGAIVASTLYFEPLVATAGVLSLIVLLLVVYKTSRGIFLLFALTPFESILTVDFTVSKVIKMILVLVVILMLFLERTDNKPVAFRWDPYRPIFVLMVCTAFLATLHAASPLQSTVGLIAIGIYVLLYSRLVQWAGWEEHGERLLRVLLAISVPCAILALLQLTFGYGGVLGSREQKDMEAQGIFFTFLPKIQRAASTFGSNNAAGAFFSVTSLIAFSHALISRRKRFGYLLVFVLSVLALFATFSRGAILGLMVGLIYATYMFTKSRWPFIVAPAILLTVSLVFIPVEALTGYFRLGTDVAAASLSRVAAWNAAMTIVEQHPIAGIGFYEFEKASEKLEGETETPTHPHNGFLKALVEQGIFGGIVYLWFLFACLKMAWKSARDSVALSDGRRWIFGAAGCTIGCLFTQEFFDAGLTIGSSSIAILFASLLAMQVNLYNHLSDREIAIT